MSDHWAKSMARQPIKRIAIVGFGEVGGIFGRDFAKQGIEVSVFDILLASARYRQQMLSKAQDCGVTAVDNLRDCVREADFVISAVTASSALTVANRASRLLNTGQIFLDINSVAPGTKRMAARYFRKAGYVEAAVMAAVPGQRLKVPMLLGGAYAEEAADRLRSMGMNTTAVSDQIGVASAVKMCRSLMVKGLEALAVECLFAARQFGTEAAVLESLAATYPSLGWKDRLPDYLISRVAEHGARRAAEMRQVAKALDEIGLKPTMARAIASRQEQLVREMAERKIEFDGNKPFSWRPVADAVSKTERRKPKRKAR
jgi:3-hydroxyisobutyrate dehydrogenase-like beta-hydroxyacid dehydrogenase